MPSEANGKPRYVDTLFDQSAEEVNPAAVAEVDAECPLDAE